MPYHHQVVCFLKGDNKYKKGRIDRRSDTKRGKQLLAQLKVDMAKVEVFETLQPEIIPLYSEDSSEVFSTSLEDEDDNVENITENSKKDVQGNYSINKIKSL